MTNATRTRAERILEKHRAGWRFAVDWPPGFKALPMKIENRGMSENMGAAWRAISGNSHIKPWAKA